MASEEIEKLRARVEKDPGSKLFVPLAEEYRKEGLFDEAISVLLRGLDNHPDYATARVFLGKVYLEKGEIFEALHQFEDVIVSKPDNLFAQKKIAEIYRELGNQEKAAVHYRVVLELNPLDVEVKGLLAGMTGMASGAASGDPYRDVRDVSGESAETEPVEESEAAGNIPDEKEQVGEGQDIIEQGEQAAPLEAEGFERGYEDIIRKADESLSAGEYARTIEIYVDLLRDHPDDMSLRQRALELRQYLKIMGKDVDGLIVRLESFLRGIKRRRDEFFGIS